MSNKNYSVTVYDKDNDYYLDILETNYYDSAIDTCKAVYTLMKDAYVINKDCKTEKYILVSVTARYL